MTEQGKLLIVDDSQYILTQIKMIFASQHLELAFAKNGQEALKQVSEFKPDIILLDIVLPDIEGYDLFDQIMAIDQNNATVIFLTSKNGDDDIVRGIAQGAADFIMKPFNGDVLKVKVLFQLTAKLQRDELLKVNEQMEKNLRDLNNLALRDSLTGVYNRHYINEHLLSRFQNSEYSVVIMCDVDNFKEINDIYGHEAGDSVLIGIAGIMQGASDNIQVIRWGGEEFLIILFDTMRKVGYAISEEIRRQVADFPFLCNGTVFHCTLTLGLHIYDLNQDFLTNVERADQALYQGKRQGKNRSIWDDGIY